jgi:phosphoribosylformylglycinamidine synthase
MKYIAHINVMPQKALLDPQGKAVSNSLKKIISSGTGDVRVGKHIELEIEASSDMEANQIVDEACKKLLCNPIMEYYEFTIKPI